MNLIELTEKTCKFSEVRVFHNYPEEIYCFNIHELAKFAMEAIREHKAAETD